MRVSINGMGVLAGAIKQPTCRLPAGESELSASHVTSRASGSVVELLDEIRVTESELNSEELVVDNSSCIDTNLSKSLGERSVALENRDLAVRAKLASPRYFHPIKISRVDSLLTPADCMTRALAEKQFQEAGDLMDIIPTPLITEGAGFGQMAQGYNQVTAVVLGFVILRSNQSCLGLIFKL